MASMATSTDERLSLGQASTSPPPKPLYTLPSLVSNLSLTSDPSASASLSSSSSALINQDVLKLATPTPSFVDNQALHLFSIEMVYSILLSSRFAAKKETRARQEMIRAGLPVSASTNDPSIQPQQQEKSLSGSSEIDSMASVRLEAIGFHVGSNMAEHLSRERAKFPETLDVLKFVCKELWTTLWGKQVDNLRTNHRGVYVLQDNAFKPLTLMSTARGPQETAREAKLFLSYPVGIIRGALAQLQVPSVVVAETSQVPQCTFHIKTQRSTVPSGQA